AIHVSPNAPHRLHKVQSSPLTRRARTDRGTENLALLCVSLCHRGAGVPGSERPVAVAGALLDERRLGLNTQPPGDARNLIAEPLKSDGIALSVIWLDEIVAKRFGKLRTSPLRVCLEAVGG